MQVHLSPTEAAPLQAVIEEALAKSLAEVIAGLRESVVEKAMRLTREEVQKLYGIGDSTLDTWMRKPGDRGGLGMPHLKIGGQTVRFTLPALQAWEEEKLTVNPVAKAA